MERADHSVWHFMGSKGIAAADPNSTLQSFQNEPHYCNKRIPHETPVTS
jgi:hypothetical protein